MSRPDFETTIKQEAARLRLEHPTPDDIPGCVSLFDAVITCNTTASQMKNLYRYGHMTKCGPKFEDFKYCMSLKGLHPEEKREAWILRRAEWWAERRMHKSSEDVWEMRAEPVKNYPPPLDSTRDSTDNTIS